MASVMNIAHRGFSSQYPENTLLAFQKALDLGVTWIEFDLQITQDGHLVVMHDRTVDRTTNGVGTVSDLTLSRVQALNAGEKFSPECAGERVPTFEQALDHLSGKARMAIELKFEGNQPIAAVVDHLKTRDLLDQVSITSFDLEKLPEVKAQCPTLSTTALFKQQGKPGAEWIQKVLDTGADTFGPQCNETTQDLVNGAHAAGFTIRCWGLGQDQGTEMERLIDLGVDGMTTDCPDILQDLLKRRNMI